MKLEDFIARGDAKRTDKDNELAKALMKAARQDMEFLGRLKIDEASARKIMANYYDVLRSILEAVAAMDGYKIYSHEAFTYYLAHRGDEQSSVRFDRFRKIRNAINYYGKNATTGEARQFVDDIKTMIKEFMDILDSMLER